MRTFHSYGPVNSKKHYYVPINKLVEKCVQSLIGDPEDLGHYFTIDEFDKLPSKIIDSLVSLFREMYLNRKSYVLHGLALVGGRAVLGRMKYSGKDPWSEQPRRKSDFHLTEAVGHFHLYHWLNMALRKRCIVRPEFPTGNGKVDLHLLCNEDNKKGLIEVKSFVNAYEVKDSINRLLNML